MNRAEAFSAPRAQRAGTEPARLSMRGVRKRFGATLALDGVDLELGDGEVLALVGENGAGKSTLMKVLSGAHVADEGQMWLDGRPFAPSGPLAARRAGVAMIYQELSLAPHLSVAENIMLGMEPTRVGVLDGPKMRRIAREALTTLGRPDIRPEMRVGNLPVGLQQMVEIARAIAMRCRVLVLDEPTSSLARADTERLFELIAAPQGPGPRHRLYFPFYRRGSNRSPTVIPSCATGRTVGRRMDPRGQRRRDRGANGRAADKRALPALASPGGRDDPGRQRVGGCAQTVSGGLHPAPG